jgi:hypothetical protein
MHSNQLASISFAPDNFRVCPAQGLDFMVRLTAEAPLKNFP